MQAWVSRSAGGPDTLVLEERPDPSPGGGELLVHIEAIGLNFPDSLFIRDLYQVKLERPFVPGSEFCGRVGQVGPGVTGFGIGDIVVGRCGWGAMAHRIAISADRCVVVPADTPRIQAAAFMFAFATAYHALRDVAHLVPGETLLVLGAAGGVGSAAVEVGAALGGRVVVATSTPEKRAFAMARGAEQGIVYPSTVHEGTDQKLLAAQFKELVGAEGANVVFDPVGGTYSEPALRCLGRRGRHLVVGFTAGIPRIPLNLALLNGRVIAGVDWRTFSLNEPAQNARNVQSLLALWKEQLIAPEVTEVFGFRDAPAALARLESRGAMGKVVISVER